MPAIARRHRSINDARESRDDFDSDRIDKLWRTGSPAFAGDDSCV
jgi:hypothetical protein